MKHWMLMPNLDNSWGMTQNLKAFVYIGPTKGQSRSNGMWDVIFTQGDVLTQSNHVIIPSDVLSEGERDT